MTRDLTPAAKGGQFRVRKPSAELRKLLDRREVVAGYGGDEGTTGGGDFRRGRWIAPDYVDIRERDEAALRLHDLKRGMEPESEAWMVDFLNVLWIGTKHAGDTTFETVAMAYPRLLRSFPRVCWTDSMLDAAVVRFPTFFPAAGELAEFMRAEKERLADEIAAHEGIVETPTKAADERGSTARRPWAQGGAEDHAEYLRAKADRERKELAAIAQDRHRLPAPPERGPGESDDSFMARLREHRHAVERAATAAMKRPFRPGGESSAKMQAAYAATGIKPKDVRQEVSQNAQFVKPDETEERLAAMDPDPTTAEDP